MRIARRGSSSSGQLLIGALSVEGFAVVGHGDLVEATRNLNVSTSLHSLHSDHEVTSIACRRMRRRILQEPNSELVM